MELELLHNVDGPGFVWPDMLGVPMYIHEVYEGLVPDQGALTLNAVQCESEWAGCDMDSDYPEDAVLGYSATVSLCLSCMKRYITELCDGPDYTIDVPMHYVFSTDENVYPTWSNYGGLPEPK